MSGGGPAVLENEEVGVALGQTVTEIRIFYNMKKSFLDLNLGLTPIAEAIRSLVVERDLLVHLCRRDVPVHYLCALPRDMRLQF